LGSLLGFLATVGIPLSIFAIALFSSSNKLMPAIQTDKYITFETAKHNPPQQSVKIL
jgi:hypothetical protein